MKLIDDEKKAKEEAEKNAVLLKLPEITEEPKQ